MVAVNKLTRRTARAARWGAGLGLLTFGVMFAEGRVSLRVINGVPLPEPPNSTGVFGRDLEGTPLTVALLGDSSAAGYGLDALEETPGTLLAHGLMERTGRRIHFHDLTVVGAMASDLGAQVRQAIAERADLAVILVGANDVVHMVRPSQSRRHLVRAVSSLLDSGCAVLVGTCPDLGTIGPILPPLRHLVRAWSRRIAFEQSIYVVKAGGRTVSLADILGPEFKAHPDFLFGPDRFHPSAAGYERLANVLIPASLAALGLLDDSRATLETYLGGTAIPIAAAAAMAANRPGTELGPTPRPRGRLGRIWATAGRR